MSLACGVTVWLAAVLASGVPAVPLQAPDSAVLAQLEADWNEAHLRGDAAALDRLWADDIVITVPGMPVFAKGEVIGVWRGGRMKFDRYETSDVRIRVLGDAAIVTGRVRRTRRMNEAAFEDDWRFTKTYVRRAGRWQVIAFHASPAE